MTIVGQAERALPREETWCAAEPDGPWRERERARPGRAWTMCKRPEEAGNEPTLDFAILEGAANTEGEGCKEPLDWGRHSGSWS